MAGSRGDFYFHLAIHAREDEHRRREALEAERECILADASAKIRARKNRK